MRNQGKEEDETVPDRGPGPAYFQMLCDWYFSGDEFTPYFGRLHCAPRLYWTVRALSLISSKARKRFSELPMDSLTELKTRMGLATSKLRKRYARLPKSGKFTLAPIIKANSELGTPGVSAPAFIAIYMDEIDVEQLTACLKEFDRVMHASARNDFERKVQEDFSDETYHFGRRRRIPREIAGDLEIYMADIMVEDFVLGPARLDSGCFPCLAEPGPKGITVIIPHFLMVRAGVPPWSEQAPVPPPMPPSPPVSPPPLPHSAGPPPLPR